MSHKSIHCREIEAADLPGVAGLLTRGYADLRDGPFWEAALERLRQHRTPPGYPRYGYLLEAGGAVVGVILLIFAHVPDGTGEGSAAGGEVVRCNVSSWYVEAEYRPFGTMLVSRALRHREATYINVTPAPHTWPILDAQGYRKYCEGRLMAFPVLSTRRDGARISRFDQHAPGVALLRAGEAELLEAHARYGCISLIAEADGQAFPFVFAARRKLGVVRILLLIYCRGLDELVRFSPSLGRFLGLRGYAMIVVDADGPVAGLPGIYRAGHPKFARGPARPRLGDVAYTERAMFGV